MKHWLFLLKNKMTLQTNTNEKKEKHFETWKTSSEAKHGQANVQLNSLTSFIVPVDLEMC